MTKQLIATLLITPALLLSGCASNGSVETATTSFTVKAKEIDDKHAEQYGKLSKEMEEKNKDLKEALESISRDNEQMKTALTDLEAANAELREKLNGDVAVAAKELTIMQARVDEIKKDRTDKGETAAQVTETLKEVGKFQEQLKANKESLAALQEDSKNLRKGLDDEIEAREREDIDIKRVRDDNSLVVSDGLKNLRTALGEMSNSLNDLYAVQEIQLKALTDAYEAALNDFNPKTASQTLSGFDPQSVVIEAPQEQPAEGTAPPTQ